MRPRFTLQKALLLLAALGIFGILAYWLSRGAPVFNASVPSTAGKILFVSERSGNKDLWMMDGRDGGNAAVLAPDPAEDRNPAWSPNGQEIAFISSRDAGDLQVFLVDAGPGRSARRLTITSSSKDSPMFGSDGRVYYLASGQLVATSPGTSDADAVFPTADARRIPGDPLASGGFTWAQPAPGLGSVAAVMRLERGSAFLLQPPSGDAHAGHDHAPGEGHEGEAAQNAGGRPLFLGLGQDVLAAWLPDNTVAVVFRNGTPTGQPIPLPTGGEWERMLPDTEGMRDSALVRFDATGRPLSVVPLPFSPTGLAVSQDGAQAALTVEEGPVGVFVLPIAGGDARRVHDRAAQSPSWSPDGRTVAFASEQDIWTVPTDGSAAATNLTKDGKNNAAPAWSPAAPKA